MVGHEGSSAGSYLTDPTSPIPSHCASIVATSTLRVKFSLYRPFLHSVTWQVCMIKFHFSCLLLQNPCKDFSPLFSMNYSWQVCIHDISPHFSHFLTPFRERWTAWHFISTRTLSPKDITALHGFQGRNQGQNFSVDIFVHKCVFSISLWLPLQAQTAHLHGASMAQKKARIQHLTKCAISLRISLHV